MSTFNIDFSKKLIEVAQFVFDNEGDEFTKVQTIIYLCYLSCEITLKALLERAGKSTKEIKTYSHDFEKLFQSFLDEIEIYKEIGKNTYEWVIAGGIGLDQTKEGTFEPTIRDMLTNKNISKYPSQLRYPEDKITAYPPQELLKASNILFDYANLYWDKIRLIKK